MSSATIDTNILISALMFGGAPLRLLELGLESQVRLDVSDAIIAETVRVLREKFRLPEERVQRAIVYIEVCTHRAFPSQTINVVEDDPADNRIVECAVAAGSDYIVTGDKDLHRLGQFGSIRVIKLADLLDIVQGKG